MDETLPEIPPPKREALGFRFVGAGLESVSRTTMLEALYNSVSLACG